MVKLKKKENLEVRNEDEIKKSALDDFLNSVPAVGSEILSGLSSRSEIHKYHSRKLSKEEEEELMQKYGDEMV